MTGAGVAQRFRQGLAAAMPPGLSISGASPLGLAVSGGGDSLALLHLAAAAGLACRAVTVDHGLRPGSAAEAAEVARLCAVLGVPHRVLRWTGWDGRGNLQDRARRARLALIAGWAAEQGIAAVALGHTRDDLAETFLMRLARGSGADGLAAMRARRRHLGVDWLRPLLALGRQELRDDLAARGAVWAEDPGNDDARYDRARARRALAALAPLGLDAARLASVAGHLAEVREALEVQTAEAAARYLRRDAGDLLLDPAALDELPPEILRRLVAGSLQWIASAEYGARGPALAALLDRLRAGRPATLQGCRVLVTAEGLRLFREWQAVRATVAPPEALWDGRWRVSGRESKGLQVRALGAPGLAMVPGWRGTGRPRASLLASPALWRGGDLVAAPLAGRDAGWQAEAEPPREGFFLSVLSH